jgi:Rps23 Pro-64 3,4-dihydroxylase Tpa1-like proline 4-hydroxylase
MNDHLEAVVHLQNIVNTEFLKRLKIFIDKKAKNKLTIGFNTKTNINIRNVKGYYLNTNTPTNLFYWNFIKNEIERLFPLYTSKFPLLKSKKLDQVDLLKYEPNGKYEIHTDDDTSSPRALSIILNINDDYDGGDLVFTDQKHNEIKTVKLTKGSIVFFPSNFMYPHAIKPITKGKRYSIVAWLR